MIHRVSQDQYPLFRRDPSTVRNRSRNLRVPATRVSVGSVGRASAPVRWACSVRVAWPIRGPRLGPFIHASAPSVASKTCGLGRTQSSVVGLNDGIGVTPADAHLGTSYPPCQEEKPEIGSCP